MNLSSRKDVAKPILAALFATIIFTFILWGALASLGSSDRDPKTAPGAPDTLVSAGAPRSQLELRRFFESMSLSYEENGLSVYEPVSAEYRRAVNERIANGEAPTLSVEEILFIISDTALAYDKYDIIRFRLDSGEIELEITPAEVEESEELSLQRSALDRISSISALIEKRIATLSHEGAFAEGKYFTDTERAFSFSQSSISFLTEDGGEVILYPSAEETLLCRARVILPNGIKATDSEFNMLSSLGCDGNMCRNITPMYWLKKTSVRIFVFNGRALLVDTANNIGLHFPENERLTSAAISDSGELYFTLSGECGSSLMRYSSSSGTLSTLFVSEEEYLAVSDMAKEKISLFRARRFEDERFVIALECVGEPIEVYS